VTYSIDAGANQTVNWSGSLAQWQTELITLPSVTLAVGNHTFSASVTSPNAGIDENTLNDVTNTSLTVNEIDATIGLLKVTLLTDNYPDETYMELTSSNGTVVWSEGNESFVGNYGTGNSPAPIDPTAPLAANTTYNYDIPLSASECYTFTIYDYYGDGLGAAQWGAGNVDGNLTLLNHTSAVLYTLSAPDFGAQVENIVKSTDDSGMDELGTAQWNLFPNPVKDMLNVSIQNSQANEWLLVDVYGKTILRQVVQGNQVQLNTQNLSNGTYFVRVNFVNGSSSVKSFVKQ
jgi:hypothetical protein